MAGIIDRWAIPAQPKTAMLSCFMADQILSLDNVISKKKQKYPILNIH